MQPIALQDLPQITGGSFQYPASGEVTAVSTDTRTIAPGCLFVALKGERFDGNDFAGKALAQGASCVVVSRAGDYSGPALLVEDTRLALGQIAAAYRARFAPFLVGVTGSVGKTSTKEMIYTVLSHRFCTMKTEGNFNNDIGLPHTLLRLEPEHEAAVIEMGMSNLGEISYLSKLCRPQVGVITNVGVSHLENLKTRDNILKAKLEILDGMEETAPLLLNVDNDKLSEACKTLGRPVITFGIEQQADIMAKNAVSLDSSTTFDIVTEGKCYHAEIPALGIHNVYNALAAFGVGRLAGMEPEEILAAYPQYQNAGMRQKLMEADGIRILADCYNASPDSMKSSLSVMGSMRCSGKRYAVLGDMLELGETTKQLHYEVGVLAASMGIDRLFAYGPLSAEMVKGAEASGLAASHFTEMDDLIAALRDTLRPGDAVGFKASRGMKLERAIEALFPQKDG